jgi:hypothetical protein
MESSIQTRRIEAEFEGSGKTRLNFPIVRPIARLPNEIVSSVVQSVSMGFRLKPYSNRPLRRNTGENGVRLPMYLIGSVAF